MQGKGRLSQGTNYRGLSVIGKWVLPRLIGFECLRIGDLGVRRNHRARSMEYMRHVWRNAGRLQ